MDENNVLFDRLAGGLLIYVENYLLHNSKGKILPSYAVDYEIPQDIISEIEKSTLSNNKDDIWYLKVSGCKNINELPMYLQNLIIQYMPKFLEQYPQYENFHVK